ncbi:ABC transporter substrate-binding protein [Frankia sp. CNm7]|uniref:ABC transporter substrate-binding protein n=1 Tax=Frankia nepalensis TaxID=1836974 RepID=A0A937UPK2_9ACTN|nr:ABC transporter substrate-binding protein [Frankia nepalensis]MBL7501264.1 ABC transporter substrate-binding protein [Frankia nepalensis]MBL7511480.1 ABC transporter substrate-binding protein [Frankia nepalensis]MBL7519543.1 ABC transporter substrate-binding protein [Frankia nepalensis]MBL7627345.1 ABC transporter substrate-binding protein [Frankia nepalensis]
MRRASRVVTVLGMAAVLGIAACSSGDDGSTGAGGAGVVSADPALSKEGPDHGWSQTNVELDPASLKCQGAAKNPTRGVTDTSVKIGGLASLTSPAGTAFGDVDKGAKARFDRANAEGGVAGRKIDFIGARDDGTDSARTLAQAKALVEQDEVFAVVPVSTTGGNYLDVFCADVVPFFGWGTTPAYCGNVIGFGITGCQAPPQGGQRTVNTGTAASVAKLLPAGAAKTLALVGTDNEAARQGNITVGQGFESGGFKVVYQESPIPVSGLTDATAIVNGIMTADAGKPPAVVFAVAQFADDVKLLSALKAAGYEGVLITPIYDPRLSGLPDMDDTYALAQFEPGIDTKVPAVAQMAKDFETYASGTAMSLPATSGYWAADMFIKALEKTGRDLTVDSLLKTLNGGDYVNYVEGAVAETRWPLNHIASAPCGTLAHLKDKTWTAPPLSCGVITKAP